MKLGDIIYFNNLVFKDGKVDQKEKRPCIFLCEEKYKNQQYVYSIPITSSVNSFNKKNNLVLIPETIYNYKKLSFANVTGIVKNKKEDAVSCDMCLSTNIMKQIIDKIIDFNKDKKILSKIKEILKNNPCLNKNETNQKLIKSIKNNNKN